jgi:hypothetical protein
MGFTVLFLLLLVTAGWWLHSRWSALRDAQAARREAELMIVFEARSKMGDKPVAATPAPSDFYPTLPEHDAAGTARPVAAMPQAQRQRAD